MELVAPAQFVLWGINTKIISVLIPIVALVLGVIIKRRMAPLLLAAGDARFSRWGERLAKVISLWLIQVKQPRYHGRRPAASGDLFWFSGAVPALDLAGVGRLCQ